MSSSWFILFLAGLLEICWVVGLRYTEGFTRLWPSLTTLVALLASMYLLSQAVLHLPIGTAYAVWVGIGTVGAAIMGVLLFAEPVTVSRMVFMTLLVIAILGLKLTAGR